MKIAKDIVYGPHPAQRLDLYLPDGIGFPTFVYLHGGGFETRDRTHGRVLAEYLAQHGVATVCAGYRQYPEAVYPDYIRDSAAAVACACRNMEAAEASM